MGFMSGGPFKLTYFKFHFGGKVTKIMTDNSDVSKAEIKSFEEFNVLRPILSGKKLNRSERRVICAELGISSATYYRKLNAIRRKPLASSLISKKRGPTKGSKHFSDNTELLIQEVIQTHYLTKQKQRASKVYLKLIERFDRAKIRPPSERTFRRRIKLIGFTQTAKSRMYASEYRSKHSPKTTHLTSPAPMVLVQMDHTELNAIIISQLDGEPLGRVILTVVMDVHTRMVLGFYIDIFGPNHENVSHAMAHACFDKTKYLKGLGLPGSWANLGLPLELLLDNAAEFKSVAIAYGCGEYGIKLKYRPVATPHYGGHSESLIGTLNENLRNIPGATFASIEERGDYPSEKLACFTLPYIEKYVANHIVNFYHKTTHSDLGISPNQKYEEALHAGFVPRKPPKEKGKFIADFSKSLTRNVRDLGIEFECKEYWDTYVATLYDQNIKVVRVLPISQTIKAINILGTDGEIHRVPAKNRNLPDVTRREWKRYHKIIKQRNNARKMTNREIANYIRQENAIEEAAKKQCKRLRRARESQIGLKSETPAPRLLQVPKQQNDNVEFDPAATFITYGGDDSDAK